MSLNVCIFSLVVLYINNNEIHIILLCAHSFVFVVLRIENGTPSEVQHTDGREYLICRDDGYKQTNLLKC